MARTTLNAVKKALETKGHKDVELVKGIGYFYFSGPETNFFETASVGVFHLSSFTVEEWVGEYETLLATYQKQRPVVRNQNEI